MKDQHIQMSIPTSELVRIGFFVGGGFLLFQSMTKLVYGLITLAITLITWGG